jgi:hypothetical protein
MSLAIISADERRRGMTVKGQIWGGAGVGKTTLLKTLDPATTLAVVPEGGMLSVQKDDEFGPAYAGDSMEPTNWPEHKAVLRGFQLRHTGEAPGLLKYKTVFHDSISIISKHCFEWCQTQPDAFNKQGQPDVRGAYGLLAREMSEWAWGWKGIPDINVWMIGGLEAKENDVTTVKELKPLVMGSRLATELPYIMDYSLVMARFRAADGETYTGLFTDPTRNPEYASVPVKTRGGGLLPIEKPHLGELMAKALGSLPPAQSAPPPSSVSASPSGEASTPPTNSMNEAA